jgi:hypothetical protein
MTRSSEQHGQTIGDPPSGLRLGLGGGWVSSATLLAALHVRARPDRVARQRRIPARQAHEHRPHDPIAIIDAAAPVLGVQDHLTPADKTRCTHYLTDGGANPTLRPVRLRHAQPEAARSLRSDHAVPAYQLH